MKILYIFSGVLIILSLSSCSKAYYYSDDAKKLANNHQIIAVVPPDVIIDAKKKDNPITSIEKKKQESLAIQNEIYSWLNKRKMQGDIKSDILDVNKTNSLLNEAGHFETPLLPQQICQLLQVDGIVTSNFNLAKPLSDVQVVGLSLLFRDPFFGLLFFPSNQVKGSLSVHDMKENKIIWTYDRTFSGSLGITHDDLVYRMMRRASKRLPYL
jgi:hypothetical protein